MTANPASRYVVYIAIELSASTWLDALQRPMLKKVRLRHLEAGDTQGLLALISEERSLAVAEAGVEAELVSWTPAKTSGFLAN